MEDSQVSGKFLSCPQKYYLQTFLVLRFNPGIGFGWTSLNTIGQSLPGAYETMQHAAHLGKGKAGALNGNNQLKGGKRALFPTSLTWLLILVAITWSMYWLVHDGLKADEITCFCCLCPPSSSTTHHFCLTLLLFDFCPKLKGISSFYLNDSGCLTNI